MTVKKRKVKVKLQGMRFMLPTRFQQFCHNCIHLRSRTDMQRSIGRVEFELSPTLSCISREMNVGANWYVC